MNELTRNLLIILISGLFGLSYGLGMAGVGVALLLELTEFLRQ